jgi:hypothetical protein
MDAQSLYSCGFSAFCDFDPAWLSEADFKVCCPFAARARRFEGGHVALLVA